MPIYALVLGFGIALAFSSPASRSLPADLVDADRLPWLIARSVIAFEIGIIAGPVLGGFLYAADVRLPFVATAGLLLVMAGAILVVRIEPRTREAATVSGAADVPSEADRARARAEVAQEAAEEPAAGYGPAAPPREGLQGALEGFRFVRSEPIVLGAISLDLFAVLFGGAIAPAPRHRQGPARTRRRRAGLVAGRRWPRCRRHDAGPGGAPHHSAGRSHAARHGCAVRRVHDRAGRDPQLRWSRSSPSSVCPRRTR